MLTNDFKGCSLSRLGFGTMRLPLLEGESSNTAIDVKQVDAMVDYAMQHGVNYFDTAYPYHGGLSETVIGASLARYPRESYYLADKYPGHQISDTYDPAAVFEEQLAKCGVEYFDFYLLHNIYENSIGVYTDPRWGIIDYFLEQKRLGRIRHLGFSCHGELPNLTEFLDSYGDQMEFCQIQLNYLDWTFQDAKAKVDLIRSYHIPIWVMEPLRGGRLAGLSEEDEKTLKTLRPDEEVPAWAFRFLQSIPDVGVVLSGMSDLEQLKANIETYETDRPLTGEEMDTLLSVADGMLNRILPCTACRYCVSHCPKGLDIPMLLKLYNDNCFTGGSFTVPMALKAVPEEKHPSACIGCQSCEKVCPQQIKISGAMANFAAGMKG